MARRLRNKGHALRPCTLPPRARFKTQITRGLPHARFGLGKRNDFASKLGVQYAIGDRRMAAKARKPVPRPSLRYLTRGS
jgi:hypothetical protein